MLSRIENSEVEASITCLAALARALNVPLTGLIGKFDYQRYCKYMRAGDEMSFEEPFAGYFLQHMVHAAVGQIYAEIDLVTLSQPNEKLALCRTRGMKFMYVLSGSFRFRCGERAFSLVEGDSLLFSSAELHGPEEVTTPSATYLSCTASRRD